MDNTLQELLQSTLDRNLYQVVMSNPRDKKGIFKMKIRPVLIRDEILFQETAYEGTKVYHNNYSAKDMLERIARGLEEQYRQCEIEHQSTKAVILVSKKGKMTINRKKQVSSKQPSEQKDWSTNQHLAHNRTKKYILQEGVAVPFLVDLGVQTTDGRIVKSRYDKFKQINRFLEFIEDILPSLSKERTVHIIDFGCGKSYLTFAMYYYLHELQNYDVEITGLDLKEDVIEHCNALAGKYGYEKLHFLKGDIAQYEGTGQVDMVVTLHACDTATDYALQKAVNWNAKVILSVPCCQHEVNKQIENDLLEPVLQYGILKEKMSALITDGIRANMLEINGYTTNILEFIDMEHTPKNLLIRAVKREKCGDVSKNKENLQKMTSFLQVSTTLQEILR